jgi:hypothetical protein
MASSAMDDSKLRLPASFSAFPQPRPPKMVHFGKAKYPPQPNAATDIADCED